MSFTYLGIQITSYQDLEMEVKYQAAKALRISGCLNDTIWNNKLLQNNTFICGTVKMNKKFLPPQAKQKQKRGELMHFENRSGVKFLKWTDKRPVCMLTTSKNHRCKFVAGTNGKVKPDAVFDYNIAKKGVDLSDQLSGYYSCLRKTI